MRVLGLSGKTYQGEGGCLVFMNATQKYEFANGGTFEFMRSLIQDM